MPTDPQVWRLVWPPEPGPEVVAVTDSYGRMLVRRTDGWRFVRRSDLAAMGWMSWSDMRSMQPLTDATREWTALRVLQAELPRKLREPPPRWHDPAQCEGQPCCIHHPSDHHMVDWRQVYRGDRGIMERICPHGVGHPDPDDLGIRTGADEGIHGCDGCCSRPDQGGEDGN
jgi:hypothetical protein